MFLLPAFAGAVFNLGVIVGAVLLHQQLGIESLAVGVLLGALGQVALQLLGLRGMRYRPWLSLRHPVVRRILWLYAPVALGISFSIIGTLIDRRLASSFQSALETMRYATTLIQFPLGLVAAAISLAVLPTLSRQDAQADQEAFRQTLGMGLKVVLLLVLPATLGLAALAMPIVTLILEYGAFAAEDTAITARALLFYLPSLPAAAVDQLLIFAFYARKRTLTPNLVQGAAIGVYLLTALPLLALLPQLGFLALVIGNSAQWIGHALLMYVLLRRHVSFAGLRLGEALVKALLASLLMALVVYGFAEVLLPVLLPVGALLRSAPVVVVAGGVLGALVYVGLSLLLRVEALGFFTAALLRKVRPGR
jgi:putative peptidoglycan lipid II flippase